MQISQLQWVFLSLSNEMSRFLLCTLQSPSLEMNNAAYLPNESVHVSEQTQQMPMQIKYLNEF